MNRFLFAFVLVITIGFTVSGCTGCSEQRTHRPAWAEPYNPDYQSVKGGYRELASDIGDVMRSSKNPILSFEQLTIAMQKEFPDLKISRTGENPFPGVLPHHKYYWLSSWTPRMNDEESPLIWTLVHDEEPFVLFITPHGKIVPLRTNDFERLLRRYTSQGAVIR